MPYSKKTTSNFIIGTFYPSGEPILPDLLRYRAFAVKDHSFIPCALHLQQPRLVNNPGKVPGWILVNPGESHPEQRGHGSSRESRGERCEDRKGFSGWGKSLSFEGTYQCPSLTTSVTLKID